MFKHKHNMPFKTLTIKESAYKEILKLKKKDESFSDFFERIAKEKKKKPDLTRFYGAWKISDEEWNRIEETIKKRRNSADKNYRERLEKLFK